MRVGIFAPGLLMYGGGEKYVCKIAEILSREHQVDLITATISEREVEGVLKTLEERLNVNLGDVDLKALAIPSIVKKHFKINLLTNNVALSKCSKKYDLFINQSAEGRGVPPAYAKKNILIVQVSPPRVETSFLFGTALKFFFDANLSTYDKIVVYSSFVKKRVEQKYARKVEVLYPPIDSQPEHHVVKERWILSVGRFFEGGHSKKQLEMIRAFKHLYKDAELDEDHWEYHLVGGVSSDEKSQLYKSTCEKEAEGYPIFFHFNAPYETVKDLYGRSTLFWHATGFDEDENRHPEKMESFGIVTAEAMSYGCIPVVVGKGGQPEIVHHGLNGMLWSNLEELEESTLSLIKNPEKREKFSKAAAEASRQFQTDQFEISVGELLI